MSQQIIIDYWTEKAIEDLASAQDNLKSDRYHNAVRDAYYACFHAFSSV
ncbi:MAG: HEPN domain-containing protein, partial [Desulfosarcina sp.]|nr:HEPN domain-containing protein [Desulfobacterales bacterium]